MDKSKTKPKEKEEHPPQEQEGEMPTTHHMLSRFEKGLDGCPEVKVMPTFSGTLMTKEEFMFVMLIIWSTHSPRIMALPVLLLLNGHRSRWSVPALQKLMANNSFPFFITSHTSIWAQPNDVGVNKQFHWATKLATKTV
jgi:hypothetical protein